MTRSSLLLAGLCLAVQAVAADAPPSRRDLFIGEAFFHARQGEYFDAITRLDVELQQFRRVDEPVLDPLHFHAPHAEFSVGDFELSYRMHQRAGRAIRAVLEGNVSDEVRNEAAYRLARIQYEKGDVEGALQALARIQGQVPDAVRDEERLLRAQVYMAANRLPDAVALLEDLRGAPGFAGFAGYNLGVALIGGGREREGREQLARTGQIEAPDAAAQSIRDKANLALGYRLLAAKEDDAARQYLDRVRLEGPFSDKALLGSGWAAANQGQFDRALVPWSLLVKRNPTDRAVQEALLGVPYAYAQLDLHGRAALLYGSALDHFGREIDRLKASVESIRDGRLLSALGREEMRRDSNWVVRLRELPEAPETFYLTDLMAANDFQFSLRNYLDLMGLQKRLETWSGDLDAWEGLIDMRRRYYEPLLPDMDKRFRVLDSQIRLRLEQRASLQARLHQLLVQPRPEMLVTADERQARAQLERIETRYRHDDSPAGEVMRERLARLRGVLHWDVRTGYDQRLTDAFEHLRALDADVARLQAIQASFVRTRQAATQSYQGYDDRIRVARQRIAVARERVATLIAGQGGLIEVMAIDELEKRRSRLEQYQLQARFAMAESYDRALKAQQAGEVSRK